jgi:3-oxoacyl-[acyl-carrier protein] reductase
MELSQANILITGAGRGIGNFLANTLLPKAAKIVVIDHDQTLLDAFPKQDNLITYCCDLTNAEQVEKRVAEIFASGGVNVCINNAGIIHNEPLVNTLQRPHKKHSTVNWLKVMDINLNAVFYVTAAVADGMIAAKQKGVIINISSISAQGNTGQAAYSASKAAVEALTKTCSKELSMFGIRCACIAPGFFNTPSTRENLSENMLSKWERSVPLGRLGELDEIGSAVEFIIHNEYFNGKILSLDGGLHL